MKAYEEVDARMLTRSDRETEGGDEVMDLSRKWMGTILKCYLTYIFKICIPNPLLIPSNHGANK